VVEYGRCTLFSRNGHPFASFSELASSELASSELASSELASRIGYALMPRSVVLDSKLCAWIKMDDASSMTCYSGMETRTSLHSIFSRLMGGTCVASAGGA
jgi:hypothetical protein